MKYTRKLVIFSDILNDVDKRFMDCCPWTNGKITNTVMMFVFGVKRHLMAYIHHE